MTEHHIALDVQTVIEVVLMDDGLQIGALGGDAGLIIGLHQLDIYLPGDERDDPGPARQKVLAQIDALRKRVEEWKW